MSHYLKKQFFIGFIYLIIIGAIGSGVFFGFFYSPESCFDGKLNQNEEQTDCGGLCAECQENLSNPKIIWAKVFKVEENLYDLAAEIENLNVNYGSEALPYIFKVYDSKNSLILEKRGRSYIMPREKKYIIEVVSLDKAPAKIDIKFSNIEWKKFKILESINLPIFNSRLDLKGKDGYAAYAEGTVYNQTRFDLGAVDIAIVIKDLKGSPVAVNKTQKNTVKSGERRFFEVVWSSSFTNDESKVKLDMRAYTNEPRLIETFIEK